MKKYRDVTMEGINSRATNHHIVAANETKKYIDAMVKQSNFRSLTTGENDSF